jgi:nitrogen fixation protein FixH
MTARHQIRIGSRRLGRDRSVIDAHPAPSLGEVLQAARERKGVDLFRAERDTKIRLKYLAALEDDHLAELPPPVYTKGFLRNYALYLGLEPDEVIDRWRDQLHVPRRQERVVVAPPPRPLAAPRRGFSLSPGMIVGAMLTVAVLAFVGYIGWQVMRFALDVPTVAVTFPAGRVVEMNAETVTLRGTLSQPGEVTITDAEGRVYIVNVSREDGSWSQAVPLSVGRNTFSIVGTNRSTERDSDPLPVIINVPMPDVGGSPSPDTSPQVIAIGLTSPTSGQRVTDGRVTIAGTTSGTRITVNTELLAALPGTSPSPEPEPGAEPSPDGSPSATVAPQAPVDITVPIGGTFSQTIELDPGRWRLTVTAHATGRPPVSEIRLVTVEGSASGPVEGEITLVIEGRGGSSWMRIVVDGERLGPRQWGGPTLRNGATATITAEREIWFRTGNAGNVHITLNGEELGALGRRGQVGNWIITPGNEPQRTSETR